MSKTTTSSTTTADNDASTVATWRELGLTHHHHSLPPPIDVAGLMPSVSELSSQQEVADITVSYLTHMSITDSV